MKSIFGFQFRTAFVCALCFGLGQVLLSRALAHDATQKLILVGVGNGKTSHGHDVSIHFYKAPDGTAGRVDFTTLDSPQAAEAQIEEWTKRATLIKSREHYDDESGHGFNDRILAEWKASTGQDAKSFLIIRRDKTTCYLIESPSMQVAEQIEQLIKAEPGKASSRP